MHLRSFEAEAPRSALRHLFFGRVGWSMVTGCVLDPPLVDEVPPVEEDEGGEGMTPVPCRSAAGPGRRSLVVPVLKVPVCGPPAVGTKATSMVQVAGVARVPTQLLVCVNGPLMLTPETVPDAVPVFVMVTVRDAEVLIT